jgi:excisionase family DNA binding protein
MTERMTSEIQALQTSGQAISRQAPRHARPARSQPVRMQTPAQVGQQHGVDRETVIAWIKSGELRAVNLARKPGGRPRYKIDVADLDAFLERRSVQPRTASPCRRSRRRPHGDVIEFF